jgi:hypothetical protein
MNVIRQILWFFGFFLVLAFSVISRAEESACDALYERIMQPGFDDADAGRRTALCYENAIKKESEDKSKQAEAYYRIGVARYFAAASSGDIAEMEKSRDALQKAVELDPEHAAARDQLMKAQGWIRPKGK